MLTFEKTKTYKLTYPGSFRIMMVPPHPWQVDFLRALEKAPLVGLVFVLPSCI